jgi:glutamine amidotransferase
MCLAIYKPKDVIIPSEYLEEGYASNPDGAGFCVSYGPKFIIRKGFFSFAEFMRAYVCYQERAALVHFRIATSGDVSPDMCHPFLLCGGKYAMVHNGIFNLKPHKGKSDTATFADSILTPLLDQGVPIDSPELKYLVETSIGKSNKILVMDSAGKVTTFNEDSGHWEEGIWYSNNSYLPYVPNWNTQKVWSEAEWKQWTQGRRGTLLNELRECEICGSQVTNPAEDYCDTCLRDWEEEITYK